MPFRISNSIFILHVTCSTAVLFLVPIFHSLFQFDTIRLEQKPNETHQIDRTIHANFIMRIASIHFFDIYFSSLWFLFLKPQSATNLLVLPYFLFSLQKWYNSMNTFARVSETAVAMYDTLMYVFVNDIMFGESLYVRSTWRSFTRCHSPFHIHRAMPLWQLPRSHLSFPCWEDDEKPSNFFFSFALWLSNYITTVGMRQK